jgi:hypothetical protein
MPSINWMLNGVSIDSSTSKNPTESIAGNQRGSFMHSAGGFKAGWDKWCGMDVSFSNLFISSLSSLHFLIDLWYISSAIFVPRIFSDVRTSGYRRPHFFGPCA